MKLKKSMILGNKICLILILTLYFIQTTVTRAEEKIISTHLINVLINGRLL